MSKEKKLKYDQCNIRTDEQDAANSEIMEVACDLAEKGLVKEMGVKSVDSKKITVYDKENDCYSYTDEAQEIFDELYDKTMDEVYVIANTIKGKVTTKSLRKAMAKKK
jgi:hypothetical protein